MNKATLKPQWLLYIIFTITITFSVNLCASIVEDKTITIGYFSLPPHVIIGSDDEHPTGAAVEYFNQEIAKRLNVKIKWLRQPLTRSLKSMKEGEIDAVISLGKNDERAKYLLYPTHPYHYIRAGMIVLSEDPLNEIKSVDNILDRKILIIKGWLQSKFVVKNRESLQLEYIYGDNTARRLASMLLKKRFTMAYSPIVSTILYNFKVMNKSGRVRVLSLPNEGLYSSGLYTVFSSVSGKNLAIEYEKITAQLNQNAGLLYQKYLAKYID